MVSLGASPAIWILMAIRFRFTAVDFFNCRNMNMLSGTITEFCIVIPQEVR
jgi:uncharacterized protein YraI